MSDDVSEAHASMAQKLIAALCYAVASTLIMFVNKIVLTTYQFPSYLFVAAVQYVVSIAVLLVQRRLGLVKPFPVMSPASLVSVFPVPLIFLCNTVSGLGATKKLNMPLFVMLRRFSIVMTMVLEVYMLQKQFPRSVQAAMALMMLGAVVAASGDLSFDTFGVVLITINNFATALQGVGLRKKMDQLAHTDLGTAGIMYYNNLVSMPFIFLLLAFRSEEIIGLSSFPQWGNPGFLLAMAGSGTMGFALNYCYYWCTRVNSPTSTTMVGACKNTFTSYFGMLFSDYKYTHLGFAGINISVVATLWYNYEEYKKVRRIEAERTMRACPAATTAVIISPRAASADHAAPTVPGAVPSARGSFSEGANHTAAARGHLHRSANSSEDANGALRPK